MKIPHTVLETNLVLELIKELQIKSKTVMSWRSQKKKRAFFVLFILFEEHFLTLVFYLYGGPQVSRQKKKAPGKRKMLAAKKKLFTAKEKSLR